MKTEKRGIETNITEQSFSVVLFNILCKMGVNFEYQKSVSIILRYNHLQRYFYSVTFEYVNQILT